MDFVKGKSLITENEFVTCPYCGENSEKWRYLHWKHLKLSHNKTLDDVRKEFPKHPTMTKSFDDDRLKGAQKTSENKSGKKKVNCICGETLGIIVGKFNPDYKYLDCCKKKGIENPDGRSNGRGETNRKKSLKEKYGVTNISNIDGVIEKRNETNYKRYGGTGFASKELAQKTTQTIREKYGSDNIMQTEEGLYRFIKGLQNKYGNDITNPQHLIEVKNKTSKSMIENIKINGHHMKNKTYNELYGEEAAKKLIELRRKFGATGYEMAPQTSKPQLELYELVKEIFPEARLEFGQNLKYDDQRYYYFLDIAIHELKICIEYDGSFWHDENLDKFRDKVLSSFGWKILRYVDRVPSKIELENDLNKIL